MTLVLRWLGYIQPSHLPYSELLKFIVFANFSIVGMNVSLMWNSVGFYQVIINAFPAWTHCTREIYECTLIYQATSITTLLTVALCLACQIAKLTMIPVSCLLEIVFDKIRYSRDTKLSILVVLLGVAVCTVTDVSVNAKGFAAAFIAVWSTSLQQYVSST